MMTVSVCTTVYNEGPILEKCLKTIRRQLSPDDEIVICDAGSTARTLQVEQKYADLVIIHPKEGGRPITRGKGRQIAGECASGDIIVSIDGDCIAYPKYINTIKTYFQHHPEVTLVYGDTYDTKGRLLRTTASIIGRMCWGAGGCNMAYRRSIFKQVQGYKDLNWWEDIALFKDFPEEKHFINNPMRMELCARFSELWWAGAFGSITIGYLIWKIWNRE